MRRDPALVTMLLAELGVLAVGLVFHLRLRVSIVAAFHAYATPMSPSAALALSPWLLPGALAFAALATVIALVAPLRRAQRGTLVGAGLLVASSALIFAVWAGVWPMFQPE